MFPFSLMSDKTVLAVFGIGLAIAAFSAGALVNGWRLKTTYLEEKATLNDKIHDLESKVVTQNAAVDTLYQRSKDAELRRKQAEKYSADIVNSINKRKAVIESSTATDCEGVLKEAWEDAK